jgi:NAD(P)H dehydrogenase (quinone)
MYVITGITGQIGGAIGRALLNARQPVRAVVRDVVKGQAWADQGCAVALAAIEDASSLAKAFRGAEAVFVLVPPYFDPQPGFPEARAIATAVHSALQTARPERVVYLSTIGAQAVQENLLSQHTLIEEALGDLPVAITYLRPAWFMENSRWDAEAARYSGVVPSFLQPLDKPVPMVATADIGALAATLLQTPCNGHRVVELEGPRRFSPNDVAATFAKLLKRAVRMEAVPRETWEAVFRSQGIQNPLPRIRMLDGFNEGWIEFESGPANSLKGATGLEDVLAGLLT